MHILRCPKMVMAGRNYLVKECVDIFMKIINWKLELQDITMFMVQWAHLMVEGKKHLLLYAEN